MHQQCIETATLGHCVSAFHAACTHSSSSDKHAGMHICCQAALRTHHGCEANSLAGLQAMKAGHGMHCMGAVSSGLAP